MKQLILSIILLMSLHFVYGQSIIEWNPNYQIGLKDFKSPQTEINPALTSFTIFSGAKMDFSFQMSTGQFMFTKNFNDRARTVFYKNAAIITAPDSLTATKLVALGQFSFDLAELYTRKFRKEMNTQKNAFSDVNFFKPIFDRLQVEMNNEQARIIKVTDLGMNDALLGEEHQKILEQIEELADFCKSCKPVKKKKKKAKN